MDQRRNNCPVRVIQAPSAATKCPVTVIQPPPPGWQNWRPWHAAPTPMIDSCMELRKEVAKLTALNRGLLQKYDETSRKLAEEQHPKRLLQPSTPPQTHPSEKELREFSRQLQVANSERQKLSTELERQKLSTELERQKLSTELEALRRQDAVRAEELATMAAAVQLARNQIAENEGLKRDLEQEKKSSMICRNQITALQSQLNAASAAQSNAAAAASAASAAAIKTENENKIARQALAACLSHSASESASAKLITDLKSENGRLNTQLQQGGLVMGGLRKENVDLANQLTTLAETTKRQVAIKERDLKDTAMQLQQKRAELDQFRKLCQQTDERCAQVFETNASLERQVQDQSEKLGKSNQEIARLQNAIASTPKPQPSNLPQQLVALEERVKTSATEIQRLKEVINMRDQTINDNKNLVVESRRVSATVGELQTSLSNLNTELQTEHGLRANWEQRALLAEQKSTLTATQFDDCKSDLEEHRTAIDRLLRTNKDMKQKVEQAKIDSETAEELIRSTKEKLEEAAATEGKLAQCFAQLKETKEIASKRQDDIVGLNKFVKKLQTALRRCEDLMNTIIETWEKVYELYEVETLKSITTTISDVLKRIRPAVVDKKEGEVIDKFMAQIKAFNDLILQANKQSDADQSLFMKELQSKSGGNARFYPTLLHPKTNNFLQFFS